MEILKFYKITLKGKFFVYNRNDQSFKLRHLDNFLNTTVANVVCETYNMFFCAQHFLNENKHYRDVNRADRMLAAAFLD